VKDSYGITPSMAERGDAVPDPSWRGLYMVGGITALLYILLGLIAPGLMTALKSYDFYLDAPALLAFIAADPVWFTAMQTLVLGSSVLAILTFAALFAALKHLDQSLAAVGALVGGSLQLLFMAYYPVLLGLVHLAYQYPAADQAKRAVLATAAEALLAQNNAFNPLYESAFAAGILLISIVMLKGVFPRWVAFVGMANLPACLIAFTLWPLIGIGYFWWWIFFVIWFTAVGVRLIALGRNTGPRARTIDRSSTTPDRAVK
jgi:hypothetical protein